MLPPDAPDPRDGIAARVRALHFSVLGLAPQRSLEDHGLIGITESTGDSGPTRQSVSVGYALWRNPDDRDDPVNLADLDEVGRASLDVEPPWPRPPWLVEGVKRMRYAQLWDAVRTSWSRDASPLTSLSRQLMDHVDHILMNQFREELGIRPGPVFDAPWRVRESAVNRDATLEIDGAEVTAAEIDTDPFVYGIGARLRHDVVVTVAIARRDLPYVRLALVTRDGATSPEERGTSN